MAGKKQGNVLSVADYIDTGQDLRSKGAMEIPTDPESLWKAFSLYLNYIKGREVALSGGRTSVSIPMMETFRLFSQVSREEYERIVSMPDGERVKEMIDDCIEGQMKEGLYTKAYPANAFAALVAREKMLGKDDDSSQTFDPVTNIQIV